MSFVDEFVEEVPQATFGQKRPFYIPLFTDWSVYWSSYKLDVVQPPATSLWIGRKARRSSALLSDPIVC